MGLLHRQRLIGVLVFVALYLFSASYSVPAKANIFERYWTNIVVVNDSTHAIGFDHWNSAVTHGEWAFNEEHPDPGIIGPGGGRGLIRTHGHFVSCHDLLTHVAFFDVVGPGDNNTVSLEADWVKSSDDDDQTIPRVSQPHVTGNLAATAMIYRAHEKKLEVLLRISDGMPTGGPTHR